LNVTKPTRPAPEHHLGPEYAYPLGFDYRPFEALLNHPDCIAALSLAMREMQGG
jgi:hypothetical protein